MDKTHLCCFFVLKSKGSRLRKEAYFVKIDKTRFKQKVLPGDTLKIKMQLTRPIKRGLVEMEGAIYVGDNIVTEAHLLAQIVRKPE